MATVQISSIWLNLASDLSQSWTFPFMTGLSSQPVVTVSARLYAGGNYRMISTPGRQSVLSVTLTAVTAEGRQALEFDLLGQLLCVRDDRGRKFYGFFSNPQVTEHPYNDECDVTLTFSEVTVSEAV